ncbi:protein STAY-GREEN LIKE [Cucumis melo var. makuwa]|uniref:Protein STAY-GREEN LIKE n=1 Tax=Cucumis melo var. makuwa TaxID=1194695 RepID=A0A5D3C6W0_CUCMM|nr:protein STAY-GREEN LIKE [Cucumis melo var. makuwa]
MKLKYKTRKLLCVFHGLYCVRYSFSPLPGKPNFKLVQRNNPALLFSSFSTTQASYNTLVSEVEVASLIERDL